VIDPPAMPPEQEQRQCSEEGLRVPVVYAELWGGPFDGRLLKLPGGAAPPGLVTAVPPKVDPELLASDRYFMAAGAERLDRPLPAALAQVVYVRSHVTRRFRWRYNWRPEAGCGRR
jgi:hypothetical protein